MRLIPQRSTCPGATPGLEKSRRRWGTSAVEFAAVAPLLFLVILGIIEFGRAMMTMEMLNNVARHGARAGVLIGSNNEQVASAVTNALTGSTISGTSVFIKVNDQARDVSAAVPGDTITVTIAVPFNRVSWLPTSLFLGNTTLKNTVSMRKE